MDFDGCMGREDVGSMKRMSGVTREMRRGRGDVDSMKRTSGVMGGEEWVN